MTTQNDRSGMEPQLGKGSSPEVEAWYQADKLFRDAQVSLARADPEMARHLLEIVVEVCPDHAQAVRILAEIDATNHVSLEGVIARRLGSAITQIIFVSASLIGTVFAALITQAIL